MIKSLAGIAASMLVALQLTTSSFAQSEMSSPQTELLLQKLDMLISPPSGPAAPVSRTFAVRVRTTVTIAAAPPPHDLMCVVTMFHFTLAGTSFFETKSQKHVTPAAGGSFVCDITTNAKWLNADDTRTIFINVTVRPLFRRLATLPNSEEYVRNRTASHNLAPIPLPAQGTTAQVVHALNL